MFLAARFGGEVVGFGYGYTGAYGHWWTDHVAGALTVAQRAEWLDPPHFEIVELHVRPAYQRSGVGSRLLAQLLRGSRTTARSSRRSAAPARRAASTRRTGGASLPRSISALGYPPYLVLGKRGLTGV